MEVGLISCTKSKRDDPAQPKDLYMESSLFRKARASALTALFVFTLTLFALPNDPVLAHIGLFSLASTLLITGAGPYALDNLLGTTIDSDLNASSEVID